MAGEKPYKILDCDVSGYENNMLGTLNKIADYKHVETTNTGVQVVISKVGEGDYKVEYINGNNYDPNNKQAKQYLETWDQKTTEPPRYFKMVFHLNKKGVESFLKAKEEDNQRKNMKNVPVYMDALNKGKIVSMDYMFKPSEDRWIGQWERIFYSTTIWGSDGKTWKKETVHPGAVKKSQKKAEVPRPSQMISA